MAYQTGRLGRLGRHISPMFLSALVGRGRLASHALSSEKKEGMDVMKNKGGQSRPSRPRRPP